MEISHPCSLEKPNLLKSASEFKNFVKLAELGRFKFMKRNVSVNLQGVKIEGAKYLHATYSFILYIAICKLNTQE